MLKKLILPAVAMAVILTGCSTSDVTALQSEVETLRAEVSELTRQLKGSDPVKRADEDSERTTAPEISKTEGKEHYRLGETIVSGGVTFTINVGERRQQLSQWITADEGYEFAIYEVDIHNTGTADYRYSQSNYSIVTGTGEIVDNYTLLSSPEKHLGSGELAPGGKRLGWVAFKVPQGDQPQELRFNGGIFSDISSFKVKLN